LHSLVEQESRPWQPGAIQWFCLAWTYLRACDGGRGRAAGATVKEKRLADYRLDGVRPERLRYDESRFGAAKSEIGLSACHEQGLRKNNRVENSHQPIRGREYKMQRFKSTGSAQRFLSVHAHVRNTSVDARSDARGNLWNCMSV
jgi:hypothetical protein